MIAGELVLGCLIIWGRGGGSAGRFRGDIRPVCYVLAEVMQTIEGDLFDVDFGGGAAIAES